MADYFPDITSGNSDYLTALQESTSSSLSGTDTVMGQEDFLTLLTTQLQNQDPSDPMDATSFVTDLTQMSQLQATTEMNDSIVAMTQGFQNLQTMQAASIIGKNVQVNGEDFSHTEGAISQFTLSADQPLTDVNVVISDENGVVKEMSLSDMQAGDKVVDWSGLDNYDNAKTSGVYSLTAYGTNSDGDLQSINTVVPSRVNSIGINTDGSMTLTLATGEKVAMDTVREISG
ncbi:hypothetical protein JCM30760_08220 [Thiomicrorhabdus hydrogeniphila]